MKAKKLLIPVLGASLLFPTVAGAAEQKPTVNTPAADLRATLDQLLSEHYVLAVESLTKMYDGAKDADETYKKLDQNAVDMEPAIASVYGKEGAAEFERIFRAHNEYTDDLVKATKENDAQGKAMVDKEIEQFVQEFSKFLATATEGKLPQQAAEDALRLHEQQVKEAFDDYVKGDYKGSYEAFREGFKHMYTISKVLSTAITTQMPEKFNNTKADAPAADLRSTLNSLASEHFALAVMGMQKGFESAKDYDYVTWAENANTADFKAAMKSIYGQAGADQFEKIWQTNHINAQAEIASAAAEGNKDAMMQAENKLSKTFATDFGNFLGAATENNLPAKDATAALMKHEQTVIDTFDQYMNGSYADELNTYREGYQIMFGVGQALGNAIVTQMPEKFTSTNMPTQMPKTGMGGASETTNSSSMTMWMSFGALALAGVAFFAQRARKAQQ